MPVETHDPGWKRFVFILRESDVFERPHQNLSGFLLGEIIAPQRYGEEIFVLGVPDDGSDMFLLLLIVESPNGEEFSLRAVGLFSFLPVVLVVIVSLIFFVLPNHPLHDLHAPLERGGVSAGVGLPLLGGRSLVVLLGLFLELLDIAVPNVPLGNLSS